MPIKTSLARARQRTVFKRKNMASNVLPPGPADDTSHLSSQPDSSTHTSQAPPMIPDLHTSWPPIRDELQSNTSMFQDATVKECLPFLSAIMDNVPFNQYGVPRLDRERHIRFLRKNLKRLPSPYVALDASRPWVFYWCLNGLSILGADVSDYRYDLIETARSMQNSTGGFGGGFGQLSHLACTYAIVLALSIVGGEAAYEVIDRRALWKWLCALKQPSGGFRMAVGGEVDIRQVSVI